jgi:hypothetical protein
MDGVPTLSDPGLGGPGLGGPDLAGPGFGAPPKSAKKKRPPALVWAVAGLVALVVLLAAYLLWGRKKPGPGSPSGRRPQCARAADCPAPLDCNGGYCVGSGGSGQPCGVDGDCSPPLSCVSGTCRGGEGTKCRTAQEDCLKGLGCVRGACTAKTGLPGAPCSNSWTDCALNRSDPATARHCIDGKCQVATGNSGQTCTELGDCFDWNAGKLSVCAATSSGSPVYRCT